MHGVELRLEIVRQIVHQGGSLEYAQQVYDWVVGKSTASPAVTPASPSQALAPKRRGRPPKASANVGETFAKPKKRKYTKKNTAYWGK